MIHVNIKKGSSIIMPIVQGWSMTSGNTSVLTATVTGWVCTMIAVGVGQTVLTLALASDLKVELQVVVTP